MSVLSDFTRGRQYIFLAAINNSIDPRDIFKEGMKCILFARSKVTPKKSQKDWQTACPRQTESQVKFVKWGKQEGNSYLQERKYQQESIWIWKGRNNGKSYFPVWIGLKS